MEPDAPAPRQLGRRGMGRFAGFTVGVGAGIAVLLAPIAAGVESATSSGADALIESIPARTLSPTLPERSTVVAADGSELATFFRQDRIAVELAEVAPVLKEAVLATEDARFYDHGAIDPVGMLRALATNVAAGGVEQGGSTLTQQYVKQALVSSADGEEEAAAATETTLSRKVREIGLAIALEQSLTKDEIFERYLNIVYFGNGAYGIEVAAQRYFNSSARDLTLPQAALLAGIVRAPTAYDPVRSPGAAKNRRGVVLRRMVDAGFLDADEARRAGRGGLGLDLQQRSRNGCEDAEHPYFCSYVLAEIRGTESLGASPDERMERLLTGGLTVRTTMEPDVQAAAVSGIKDNIGSGHAIGTAIVMTEPGSGAVRAIALNRAWGTGKGETKVNYAVDESQGGSAGFQAGSTFKPFVAAAALDEGIKDSLSLNAPAEVTVDDIENCTTGKEFPEYTVGNYGDTSYGSIDMGEATEMSVNTYFVQLEERTGICDPPDLAESMGLMRADGEPLSRVPSFVLGVDEVSPLRMAEAYATFAAGGVHCDSHAVTDITGADGDSFEPRKADCERVIDADVARGVTDLLQRVINGDNPRRTGAAMDLGARASAGKTGTTNNTTAVWFAGFTPDLAAAVWAGYPDGSKPLRNVTIRGTSYGSLFGGALPGPIWRDAMTAAHEDISPRPLD